MTGFLAQSSTRRTPAIISGVVPAAVALVTEDLATGAAQWWTAGQISPDPAEALALSRLRLDPVLNLRVTLGQAAGALLALPLLNAAVQTLEETGPVAADGAPGCESDS
jgi:nicotinate-nucleotide--dimethylbenzimidazole phosphoribosyltransferase